MKKNGTRAHFKTLIGKGIGLLETKIKEEMIELLEMKSSGLFLLRGRATANSNYFENSEEKQKFKVMANQYLGNYMRIMEYNLKRDGWEMVVKIRNKATIKKYFELWRFSGKSKKQNYKEIWKILSEMVRVWLNQYSNWANRQKGREGSLVAEKYQRFLFDSETEAMNHITEMREDKIKVGQGVKRFRPRHRDYDKDGQIRKNGWVSTSKLVHSGDISRQKSGLKRLYLWGSLMSVLRKFVLFTKSLYQYKNPPNSSQNQPSST